LSPAQPAERFRPRVPGGARVPLPSLPEFLALLLARGRLFELRLFAREPLLHADREGPLRWLYQQLFITPDTEKGRRLAELARDAITSRDGRWALSGSPVPVVGVVTWRPRGSGLEPRETISEVPRPSEAPH